MTSLTFQQAHNEIMIFFRDGWTPTGLKAFYEDVEDARNTGDQAFAKVRVNLGEFRQRGFGGVPGGSRLWSRDGDLSCEIHTLAGKGLSESLGLVKVVVDSFEGKHTPGGVWFQTINSVDIGRYGTFRVQEVVVFFTYDEIK